ncbi:MAG TPA: hypothetical protein VHA09_02855 [Nitrososphaera sp.]|nr:hypothetical protein [Nitrososphaera sp.]
MSQDRDDFRPKKTTTYKKAIAVSAIASTLAVTAAFSAMLLATGANVVANAQEAGKSTVTRDSVLVVGPRTIGKGEFMHIYDATPYHIMKGHVAMQVPCDDKNQTSLEVFIGQAPQLSKANPEFIKELSTPGKQCMYHVDIMSHQDPKNPIISDIVIKNTGNSDVKLTDTSTIFVGVDEIMANPGSAGGNMTHS